MASIAEIQDQLRTVNAHEFSALEELLAQDERRGVQRALASARKRLAKEALEQQRLSELYRFEQEVSGGKVAVGLDEVGRGPLAGPLTIGAVVLNPAADPIAGLNDSKQIKESERPAIAEAVKQAARAYAVVHIPPQDIDEFGIMACLRRAFSEAVAQVEAQGVQVEAILLDGNPLKIDAREINVVKGDARCASIAAASVIAKVQRDALMVAYDAEYPGYDFASSKGYGSAAHRRAIEEKGLSPIHRTSFCSNFIQERLF